MSELGRVKILIIDDHALFLEGLCYVLEQLTDEVEIITAYTANDAFEKINVHKDIHLALLDLDLPDMHGFEVLKKLSVNTPLLPVVILSASDNYHDMKSSFDGGAMGYISKTEKSQVVLNALRSVMQGEVYVPERLLTPPSFTSKSIEMIAETAALTINPLGTSHNGVTLAAVKIQYYEADRSIFIDDEYLIKGVAGAILWRLLNINKEQGRTEFSHRELRLDTELKLPDIVDNLDARLILLLRRLDDKFACIKMEKIGRGRFQLLISRDLNILPAVPA